MNKNIRLFSALLKCGRVLSFAYVCTFFVGCAASKSLPQGEYALKMNDIVIYGEDLKASEIMPYIKQQLPGFSFLPQKMVVFKPSLVDISVDNIQSHLKYLGYYNAEVWPDIQYVGSKVAVTYHIKPGSKMRISSFSYELPENEIFVSDYLKDTSNISIHCGDYLSEKSLEEESERSASFMRTRGYFGFTRNYYFFEADTLSGTDSVSLKLQIKEYSRNESEASAVPFKKFYIEDVTISHPVGLPFREKVLDDLNLVKPGDLYNENVVKTTYNRLSSVSVFNTVGVEMTKVDTTSVRCDINLKSSRVQGFKVDLEASTNSTGLMGISPQLSYYHKNIFHGGELLNLSFLGNFQFQFHDPVRSNELGVSAGLVFPKFLGLPNSILSGALIPRTEVKAAYNFQDRPEYTRRIVSTSFGYSGSFNSGHCSYQLYPLQVNIVRLFNLDTDFYKTLESNPYMRYTYQNHFDAGVGGTFYHTDKTGTVAKDPFKYYRISMDLSGNVLGLFRNLMKSDENGKGQIWGAPYTQYVKAEISCGKTWCIGKRDGDVIAAHFVAGAGYAYGNSTAMPFEKQFYCGGANSMRGWQARALGPGRSPFNKAFSIPSQTGDMKIEANLEYRFDLFWKLEGALFTDVGNVWTLMDDNELSHFTASNFLKTIAADWGYGLRCDFNFMIVRVDMGLKLYSPDSAQWMSPTRWLRDDGFAIHFGVGYPF